MTTIKGDPYDYPFDRHLRPANTALIVIDMQFDFCGEGGYVDKMGYDISLTRAAIEPIRKTLAAARAWGCHVLHTREGHRRGPFRSAGQQAIAQPANRRRNRRSRPQRPRARARRKGLADHSGTFTVAE